MTSRARTVLRWAWDRVVGTWVSRPISPPPHQKGICWRDGARKCTCYSFCLGLRSYAATLPTETESAAGHGHGSEAGAIDGHDDTASAASVPTPAVAGDGHGDGHGMIMKLRPPPRRHRQPPQKDPHSPQVFCSQAGENKTPVLELLLTKTRRSKVSVAGGQRSPQRRRSTTQKLTITDRLVTVGLKGLSKHLIAVLRVSQVQMIRPWG